MRVGRKDDLGAVSSIDIDRRLYCWAAAQIGRGGAEHLAGAPANSGNLKGLFYFR